LQAKTTIQLPPPKPCRYSEIRYAILLFNLTTPSSTAFDIKKAHALLKA
jgi:hypothetical protein